ncbi:MAG: alpha/beta hydrolase [Methylobacteriaceae bacterium]|nr:alpha/beta hydrolase [Methylobacteriaceae bacterium]
MTTLDPDNQRVLDLIKASGRPPVASLAPPEAREVYRAGRRFFQPDLPDMAEVRDLVAPGPAGDIPLRLYRGIGTDAAQMLPVLVFYHGGGYVIGDLDTHDYVCRKLANVARCAVIAVDYRLAPEHKFPAAVQDAAAALRFIVTQAAHLGVDATRVAVGGDSAGGNLSANMAHFARDGDEPKIIFQMLLYPGTDMSMSQNSYKNRDWRQYPLSIEAIKYFLTHYLNDKDYTDPRAAPLMAKNFKGLADAFVLTAGYDPLADEGYEYAKKLEANGVRVTFVYMSDQMHGFLTLGKIVRAADVALEMAGAALAHAFFRST